LRKVSGTPEDGMGRVYAGTLGSLACGMILARGVVSGGGTEATILAACGGLVLFALVGYLAGQLAEHLVRESVRTQFQAAMAAWKGAASERSATQNRQDLAKTN
jgi:hypothetical protein